MKNIFPLILMKTKWDSRKTKLLGQVHEDRKQESLASNQNFLIPFFKFCHVIQERTLFKPLSAFDANVSWFGS